MHRSRNSSPCAATLAEVWPISPTILASSDRGRVGHTCGAAERSFAVGRSPSCARVACRRGTADAPSSQATATTLAHPAGPVRDDRAPRRAVAGSRTASDGEGAVRASATGAPRDVRAGPASDSATPRQGLAPGGSWSAPPQRSERSVPGCCCVGDHRTRTSPPRSGTGRYAIRPRRYRRARPSSALTGTRNGHYGGPRENLGGKSSVRSL